MCRHAMHIASNMHVISDRYTPTKWKTMVLQQMARLCCLYNHVRRHESLQNHLLPKRTRSACAGRACHIHMYTLNSQAPSKAHRFVLTTCSVESEALGGLPAAISCCITPLVPWSTAALLGSRPAHDPMKRITNSTTGEMWRTGEASHCSHHH